MWILLYPCGHCAWRHGATVLHYWYIGFRILCLMWLWVMTLLCALASSTAKTHICCKNNPAFFSWTSSTTFLVTIMHGATERMLKWMMNACNFCHSTMLVWQEQNGLSRLLFVSKEYVTPSLTQLASLVFNAIFTVSLMTMLIFS